MTPDTVRTLAELLIHSHAKKAERVARKRAQRCAEMKERQWSATWLAVADHIAAEGDRR